jgi:hypothetical protein
MSSHAKFPNSFAGDVDPESAALMADSQVPWGVDALGGPVTEPAWEVQAQLVFCPRRQDDSLSRTAIHSETAGATVVEAPGSHAIYVSNLNAVAAFIEEAASGVK